MANVDNSNLIITAVDDLILFDNEGKIICSLEELTTVSLANNEETTDITGKNGRKLSTLKQNKSVQVTGSNGVISSGLISAQTGGTLEDVESYSVLWYDQIQLTDPKTATVLKKPVGLPGMEIRTIARELPSGAVDTLHQLQQGTTPGAGIFTFDPVTKELVFSDDEFEVGDVIRVYYMRNVPVSHVDNPSDTFSQEGSAVLNCTTKDLCNNVYHSQLRIPRASLTGNFTLDLGGEQALHNFELNAFASVSQCDRTAMGTRGIYWDFITFRDDAEDAE